MPVTERTKSLLTAMAVFKHLGEIQGDRVLLDTHF